jgi:CRISPR-associated protein Cst2
LSVPPVSVPGRFTFKRDSVLRMNLAKAMQPYRHNAVFTQSPLAAEGSAYKNSTTSALLHRETAVTAFQYPFALNLDDCKPKPEWTRALLRAVGELNDVAGNHARSYFEMAPASIVVRLTKSLVAGYETYGFRIDTDPKDAQNQTHRFPEVIGGIPAGDYPGAELFVGGKIVKDMPEAEQKRLKDKGVTVDRDPRRLLETVADKAGLPRPKEGLTVFLIRLDAPFAAFRPYTAGWFRPTAAFLTPSAAYGLLLNVAGIESRLREEDPDHDGA